MSGIVNSVVELSTFGLVSDVTGVEAGQDAARDAASGPHGRSGRVGGGIGA